MSQPRPSDERLVALVKAALAYKALGEHARTGQHLWVTADDVIDQDHAEAARRAGRPATFLRRPSAWPERAVRGWLRELAAAGQLTGRARSGTTGKHLQPTEFALPTPPRRTP